MKLSQAAIRLRTTVRDTIYYLSASNPTVNDDRNDNFIVGSRWINTSTLEEYVCVDNTQTSAVWKPTTTGGGGSGSSAHVDIVDPTNLDDVGAGYPVGTIWVNTEDSTAFISVDATNDTAIWVLISERIPDADEIPATSSPDNPGTTVQGQLDYLSAQVALGIAAAYGGIQLFNEYSIGYELIHYTEFATTVQFISNFTETVL